MLRSIFACLLASTAAMAGSTGWTASPVQAEQAQPSIGYGMFCDTGEEIETAVGISSRDIGDVLSRVNSQFGEESCNVLTAIYFKSEEERTVLVPEGIVRVLKVKLVGFRSGPAWTQIPTPMEQYVAIFEKATRI